MTLYRKYRPQHFDQLQGQSHVVEVLKSSLKKEKAAHAYLFTGPRGTGKTSTARILARALNCERLTDQGPCNSCESCIAALEERLTDLIEIDAASHGLVDDARAMVEQAKFMPSQAKKKVYIIDEVHMLSKSAFNALLKIVEEPPEHVHFIMATTEAHKVLETIKSRCQRFDFHLSDDQTLQDVLREVSASETVTLSDEALSLLTQHARGSFRDGLSLLEQFVGMEQVSVEQVQEVLGLSDAETLQQFIQHLAAGDTAQCLQSIQETLKGGYDPYQFCQALLEEMRMQMLGSSAELPFPLEWIEYFYEALEKLRSPLLPDLPLELAVYKCHRNSSKPIETRSPAKESIPAVAQPDTPSPPKAALKEPQTSQKTAPVVDDAPTMPSQETEISSELDVSTEGGGEGQTTSPAPSITGTFDKQVFVGMIDQASLRTLVKYSQLEYRQGTLHISPRSDFEVRKMKEQNNMSYLLDLLEKHLGAKASIELEVKSVETADGLSSSDLESVF